MSLGNDSSSGNWFVRLASSTMNGLHPGMQFSLVENSEGERIAFAHKIEEKTWQSMTHGGQITKCSISAILPGLLKRNHFS